MATEDPDTTPDEEKAPSPLAWGQNGEPIDLPDNAAGWRVRRHKLTDKGGPPAVVYSGCQPLILALDTAPDDFTRAVGNKPGRYRLEAVDEDGRPVKCPPAFTVIDEDDAPAVTTPAQPTEHHCCGCVKDLALRAIECVEKTARSNGDAVGHLAPQLSGCVAAASNAMLPPDKRQPIEYVVQSPQGGGGFDWGAFMQAAAPSLGPALMNLVQALTMKMNTPPPPASGGTP